VRALVHVYRAIMLTSVLRENPDLDGHLATQACVVPARRAGDDLPFLVMLGCPSWV